MRLAWGDIEEPDYFNTNEYKKREIATPWYYQSDHPKDSRDLPSNYDIVQINWPSGWYIPTAEDFKLLAESVTVTIENNWFRLTGKNGNSILVPQTGYIDDKTNEDSNRRDTSVAYLQSCTIGTGTSKPTQYALRISGNAATLSNSAGRPTGLMIRPVKYVRVN